MSNNQSVNLEGNVPRIVVKTPSGTTVQDTMTVENGSAGIIAIILQQSMFCENGVHIAEIQLWDDTKLNLRLTTPIFQYYVRKSLQNDEMVAAQPSFSLLQDMIEQIEKAGGMDFDTAMAFNKLKADVVEFKKVIQLSSDNAVFTAEAATKTADSAVTTALEADEAAKEAVILAKKALFNIDPTTEEEGELQTILRNLYSLITKDKGSTWEDWDNSGLTWEDWDNRGIKWKDFDTDNVFKE